MNIRLVILALAVAFLSTGALSQRNRNATECFRSGKEKADSKDYYGAIVDFTKAIDLRPDYAKAYYHRALAYLKYDRKSKTHSDVYKRKARADLMKAKELGFSVEQRYLDQCE